MLNNGGGAGTINTIISTILFIDFIKFIAMSVYS